MKKFMMVLLAGLMSVAPQAFAQEEIQGEAYEVDEGAVPMEELEGKLALYATPAKKNSDGEVIAGVIIGAIVGAIAADALDNQIDRHDREYRPHRPHRPGRPYPPHRPQPRPRQVVCYAQHPFGQVFRAVGNRAQAAQRQALNKCTRQTRIACRPMGCQVLGGW